jgi:hypothetical protein
MANSKPSRNAKALRNAPVYRAFSPKNHPLDSTKTHFLKNTLTAAVYNGNTTSEVIKAQLTYALNPANNITGVVFEAIEITSNNDHYIWPNNDPAGYQITKDASGAAHTLSILLVCPAPLDPGNTSPMPDKPGDVDPG